MKRRLFTLLILLVGLSCKCQVKEGFGLFTDHDLYTSGENILLKVFVPSNELPGIVNVGLFNLKGMQVSAAFLEMTDRQANGYIHLSDTLSSGCYFVRTTTRTSATQTVKEVYIANRFSGLSESGIFLRPTGVVPIFDVPIQTLQVEGIEKSYKRRENVHVTLRFSSELLSQTDGNLHVSITRLTPGFNFSTFYTHAKPEFSRTVGNEGMIISGTVTDAGTAKPFNNAIVFLTVPDSSPRFQYFNTAENGRFYFQLKNYFGEIPVVLQCFDPERKHELKIRLSNTENLLASLPDFETIVFPPELREIVAKNVEAHNFSRIFSQLQLKEKPVAEAKAGKYPFYGVPTRVVYPKQFIDLVNFDEISRELLQGVRFRENNHVLTLQLFNFQRNKFFDEQPLILLNGIPVEDIQAIRNLGTKEIDRIEECLSERFYGNLQFPGVIAIYTTKSDYSWLNESDSVLKLRLNAIEPPSILNSPTDNNFKEPDLRRVLLWLPSLKPEPNMNIEFQTSDVRGRYKLEIRGMGRDGKFFYKENFFEVN